MEIDSLLVVVAASGSLAGLLFVLLFLRNKRENQSKKNESNSKKDLLLGDPKKRLDEKKIMVKKIEQPKINQNTEGSRVELNIEKMIDERRMSRVERSAGFCCKCGRPIQQSDIYCPNCGEKVNQ